MVVSIEQFEVALSTDDVDTLLEAISEGSERFIDQLLASDRKYFHLLCERGHANVVELVLTRRGVDLEQDWQQKTPLQLAAGNGHAELVSLLLCHGSELSSDIGAEDSPHYLATLNGHIEVLKKLTDHKPSAVKSEEAHGHLLLTACSSGHLDVVKFWIWPHVNLNEPLQLVSSLDQCEDLLPLATACRGDHLEIAKFLVSMGAVITESICMKYPEITQKLMEDSFHMNSQTKCYVNMADMKLEVVHPLWFSNYLNTLTKMDLSNNELRSLPACIPWSMPCLTSLDVSRNKLDSLIGPDPDEETHFQCVLSLKSVNLSHNRLVSLCVELFRLTTLTKLNVSNNQLTYLMNVTTVTQRSRKRHSNVNSVSDSCEQTWLPSLMQLDVSNNLIKLLPSEIRNCGLLQHLNVSSNDLSAFPSAWPCRLQHLNISYNHLESQRFLVSAEEFWSDSLKILRIEHNELDEITESIVKLTELRELHASHNRLERLPDVQSWDCRSLSLLDLGFNKLGVPLSNEQIQNTAHRAPKSLANLLPWKSNPLEDKKPLDLPRFLGDCLQYLNLAHNNLNSIPDCVNHLFNIIQLNLSGNPLIKVLPKQMGLLKKCVILELEGTGIPPNQIKDQKPADLIRELKMAWRQSESCNKIKLIVLGPKEKGKSSLISLLKGERLESDIQNNDISVHRWKYRPSSLLKKNQPEVTFNIWEIPGDKTVMQSCFMTPNALYILVFDLRTGRKGVQQLSEWLCMIQTSVPGSYVLLIGTFMDKLPAEEKELKIREISGEISKQYQQPEVNGECPVILRLLSVSCVNSDGVSDLRRTIYEQVKTVRDLFYHKQFVVDRKIPRSYVLVEESLEKKLKELETKKLAPILLQEDLQEIFDSIPNDDIRILDDQDKAIQYLVEVGKVLYFNDQLECLNSIYFLKPVYLQELLNLVLADRDDMPQNAEIAISQIKQCYDQQNFPRQFFPQYLQILKKFEIALEMDEGKKLMVPSKLPRQKPVCHVDTFTSGSQICRLYRLPYIPSGLWTKLIIRVLKATSRFSHSQWFLGGVSVKDKDRKFCREKSVYGFRIKEKAVMYWREGMYIRHRTGTFMVESVKCRVTGSPQLGKGVLISVHSVNENFSLLGIIVDELDDILQDYFPGFQDFILDMPAIYAVCPSCFEHIKDTSDAVLAVDHFHVQECAAAVFTSSKITCPQGHNVQLSRLVPEMLFRELPRKFLLSPSKMELNELLGSGAGGLVYRGRYDGKLVAFKVFHMTKDALLQMVSTDSGSGTWASSLATEDSVYENVDSQRPSNPFHSKDVMETLTLKAYRAFTEFRREISVMSKLRHPCIIGFLGISIVNNLMITMEMAAEGSLRTVLTRRAESHSFNKYRDREKVFRPVLGKDITYRIIYQIAKGLQYLHDHSVIYRDLKTDNILVCSLDVSDVVNAKLTDYGISKFSTTQGLVGFKGTMGYMAPEVMCNYTYNEKVDIFSFSMVMSEILTGRLPYEKCTNRSQLHQAIIKEKQRPAVQDFNIVSHFPHLEQLMSRCWSHESRGRPSAETIATTMQDISFLCQHEVIRPENNQKYFGKITCMASMAEGSSTKKNFLWFWENGRVEGERMYSIFDLDTSRYHVFQTPSRGSEVTCMAKVGHDMWIGTKASEVEVFSCQNTGIPRCMDQLKQQASPTSILHVQQVDNVYHNDRYLGSVFLGLGNGLLVIYQHTPASYGKTTTDAWNKVRTSVLSMGEAVRSLTHTEAREEIWAACGHQIFIFCTATLATKMTLDVFANSRVERSVGRGRAIKDIVAAKSSVWCLFQDSSKLVEIDAELAEVMYIVHVRADGVYCKYLADDAQEEEEEEEEEEDSSEDEKDPEGLNQTWPRMRHSCSRDSRDSDMSHKSKLDSQLYVLPVTEQAVPEYLDILAPAGTKSDTRTPSEEGIKTNLPDDEVVVDDDDDDDDALYEPVIVGAQLKRGGQLRIQFVGKSKSKKTTHVSTAEDDRPSCDAPPIPPKTIVASVSDVSLDMKMGIKPVDIHPKGLVTSVSDVSLDVKTSMESVDVPPIPPRKQKPSIDAMSCNAPPLPPPRKAKVNSVIEIQPDVPPSLPPRRSTLTSLTDRPVYPLKSVRHCLTLDSRASEPQRSMTESIASGTVKQAVAKMAANFPNNVKPKKPEKTPKSTFWVKSLIDDMDDDHFTARSEAASSENTTFAAVPPSEKILSDCCPPPIPPRMGNSSGVNTGHGIKSRSRSDSFDITKDGKSTIPPTQKSRTLDSLSLLFHRGNDKAVGSTKGMTVEGQGQAHATADSAVDGKTKKKLSDAENVTKDATTERASSLKKTKRTKDYICSILVVEDTLWLSTSQGSIKVLSQDMRSSKQHKIQLCELECVTSTETCHITGPQPATQMVQAKGLVVSLRKVTSDPISHLSLLACWEAYDSTRINYLQDYWNKLAKKEQEFTQMDSLA